MHGSVKKEMRMRAAGENKKKKDIRGVCGL